jgi:hypothetical protein
MGRGGKRVGCSIIGRKCSQTLTILRAVVVEEVAEIEDVVGEVVKETTESTSV